MKDQKQLNEFIKECLIQESPYMQMAFAQSAGKNQEKETTTQKPYKSSKSELVFVTARNLGVSEDDVKDALDDGKFVSFFKKKNKNLTPEKVKQIKDAYLKYEKAINQ